MAVQDMTVEDYFRTLTGFDEIAITKAFGRDVSDLREKPFTLVRALVFVDARRAGAKDKDAYTTAMDATVGDLESYFAEDEEMTPEDPETEQGKDGGQPS